MISRHEIREAQKDMVQSGMTVAVDEKAALTLPPVSADTIQTILQTVSSSDISQKDSFHHILKDNVHMRGCGST